MLPLTRGFGAAVDSSVSSQWLRFCYDIFSKGGKWENNGFFVKWYFYAAMNMSRGRWRETQIPLQMA